MITKNQYDFFKSQYDAENIRYSDLIKKGQIYLSIQTFLLSAIFFKIKDFIEILKENRNLEFLPWLFVVTLIIILTSIILNIISLKISKYESPNNLRKVYKSYQNKPMPDDDFFLYRIADYTVATSRNIEANNKTANFLKLSVYFLGMGFVLTIFILSIIIIPV